MPNAIELLKNDTLEIGGKIDQLGNEMPLKAQRFGAFSLAVEGLAVALYCVLRVHEALDPQWTRDSETLYGPNKHLLQASIIVLASAAIFALIALVFDKDRIVGVLALCLVVPILVLMALFQGIW